MVSHKSRRLTCYLRSVLLAMLSSNDALSDDGAVDDRILADIIVDRQAKLGNVVATMKIRNRYDTLVMKQASATSPPNPRDAAEGIIHIESDAMLALLLHSSFYARFGRLFFGENFNGPFSLASMLFTATEGSFESARRDRQTRNYLTELNLFAKSVYH